MKGFFNMIRNSLGGNASKAASKGGSVARDRLSVMLVHQRNSDYVENIDMESLQKEVAAVIKKYIKCADKYVILTCRAFIVAFQCTQACIDSYCNSSLHYTNDTLLNCNINYFVYHSPTLFRYIGHLVST
mgnify:CR=1 FL=1